MKLKACPFCGSEVEIVNVEDDDLAYYVSCSKCQVSSCLVYALGEPAEPILTEKWNTRTPCPAIAEVVEAAKHMVATYEQHGYPENVFCDGLYDTLSVSVHELTALQKEG